MKGAQPPLQEYWGGSAPLPRIFGGASPPSPPGSYAYVSAINYLIGHFSTWYKQKHFTRPFCYCWSIVPVCYEPGAMAQQTAHRV